MKFWHKISFVIAALLTITSFAIAFFSWDKLPSIIPTHFGFTGTPDAWAPKSLFYIYMIPALQLLMLSGFAFLYYKPQYSDMPTTLLLMAMDDKDREHAFGLIRTMLVVIGLWMSVIFTVVTYMITSSAFNQTTGYVPYVMLTLVVSMIIWLIWYTVKVYKVTKHLIEKRNKTVK